ncbi:YcnI family copper-binding membrane protein [Nocardia araoensis]|uniref:YcnI family copper-binding membrane protein n=1 Tax=Nocardia araoensis TaxID=228600 RepID=UPI0002F68737|nr:YcnI family protein [Nocardia araoensis]
MKRLAATAATALAVLCAAPGVAAAHVTADAPDAIPGGYSVVTLRVPTESETADTVKLEIGLPLDHPLAVVRTATTPGWDVSTRRTTLPAPIGNGHGGTVTSAVSSVTFTALPGSAVRPGEFGEFRLLLGPLPDVRELVLPAIQTYSDGTVVSWIERSADGTQADKPAPVVRLSAESGHSGHEPSAPGATTAAATRSSGAQQDSSSGGWAGWVALVIALGALALAAAPFLRRR